MKDCRGAVMAASASGPSVPGPGRTAAMAALPPWSLTDTLTEWLTPAEECLTAPLTGAGTAAVRHDPEASSADILLTLALNKQRARLRISPKAGPDLRFYFVAGAGFEPATSGL